MIIVLKIDSTAINPPGCSFKSLGVSLSTGNLSKVKLLATPSQKRGYHKSSLTTGEVGSENVLFVHIFQRVYRTKHKGSNLWKPIEKRVATLSGSSGSTMTGGSSESRIVQYPTRLTIQ